MRASPIRVLVAVACAVLGTGCSSMFREAGKGMAAGMVQGAQTEVKGAGQTEPGTMAEHMARDVIGGSLEEVASKDRIQELQLVANAAAAAALRGMANATVSEHQSAIELVTNDVITGAMRAMTRELDAGSFVKSMDSTTEQMTGAMIRGVRHQVRDMFPECQGKDRRENCLESRIVAMSRAATAGMREALAGVISVPMLALSFIVGALAAGLLTWGVMQRHVRRMAE